MKELTTQQIMEVNGGSLAGDLAGIGMSTAGGWAAGRIAGIAFGMAWGGPVGMAVGALVGVGFALATSDREEQRIEVSTSDE